MIPIPLWVYPTAGAALLAIGAVGGWTVQGWRWSAADAERLEAELKAKDKQLAKSNESAAGFEQDRAAIDTNRRAGETTIRTVYETRTVPSDCELAPDARRVLEQALQRANSTAGQSGKPVPVTP